MSLGLTRQRPGDLPLEVTAFVGRRLGRGSGERWQQSYLLLLEGMCLFVLGDLGPSGEAFGTALAMKHEIGDTMGMGYALEGTGWLAAAERRFTRAAWLLGAAAGRWQLLRPPWSRPRARRFRP